MISFISGKVVEKNPAYALIECNGIGYHINISLNTFAKIQNLHEVKLYTHFHVKEDAQTLYGFADKGERSLFKHLISVSGVGPNTAVMILSSYKPEEIKRAIITEDVQLIQSVKGIGPKSAKRLILELKDQLRKDDPDVALATNADNTLREEALSALIMLGFNRNSADKAVLKAFKVNPDIQHVEELVKEALKNI